MFLSVGIPGGMHHFIDVGNAPVALRVLSCSSRSNLFQPSIPDPDEPIPGLRLSKMATRCHGQSIFTLHPQPRKHQARRRLSGVLHSQGGSSYEVGLMISCTKEASPCELMLSHGHSWMDIEHGPTSVAWQSSRKRSVLRSTIFDPSSVWREAERSEEHDRLPYEALALRGNEAGRPIICDAACIA